MIKKAIHFSLIVPIYNEEKSIEKFMKEIQSVLNKNDLLDKIEIIVINDGSTDKTLELLSNYNNIKIITNSKNRGYGYSIKKGILNSKYNNIVIMDADLTYSFNNIIDLLKRKNDGYDLVIGVIQT